jgi:hypothetical protein
MIDVSEPGIGRGGGSPVDSSANSRPHRSLKAISPLRRRHWPPQFIRLPHALFPLQPAQYNTGLILLKRLCGVKHVAQRMVATDQKQCENGGDEISCEKFSPCQLSQADVGKHSRHDDESGLEQNRGKDYSEHDRRLFHGCVQRADDDEPICETQREMDQREFHEATQEMNRLKRLTPHVIESREPEPRSHANDQSEAKAFARGAVSLRRVTGRGRARYNVNVFHDNMIRRSADVLQ